MHLILSQNTFITQIIAILILTINVHSQELHTAKILVVEGKVDVRRRLEGKTPVLPMTLPVSILIKPQDLLFSGDTIITSRSGRMVLLLADGSQIIIAPKSVVKVEDLTTSPRNLINVIKGKTRIQIEKIGGAPNPYRVNTPTTVIAVRGTLFDVLVDDGRTDVFLHEGEVVVTNRRFPAQPIELSAGNYTRIKPQSPPLPPVEFSEGRNDRNFRIRSKPLDLFPVNSTTIGGGDRQGIDQRQPRADAPPSRPKSSGGGNIHSPSPARSSRSRTGGRP